MRHDFVIKHGPIIHLKTLQPRREKVNQVPIAQTLKVPENSFAQIQNTREGEGTTRASARRKTTLVQGVGVRVMSVGRRGQGAGCRV